MKPKNETTIFNAWKVEIFDSISESKSFITAHFSLNGDLIYSNPAFKILVKEKPIESFLNPTFDELLKLQGKSDIIFDGFITFGSLESINNSAFVKVYQRDNGLFIIGSIESEELIDQNKKLLEYNKDVVDLQRDLLKKSHILENTLKELNASNNKIKKEQKTRNKLFSVIAHDLRSPFNGILGLSDYLIENLESTDRHETLKHLSSIKMSADNTLVLLDNLLNWAKAQTGQLSFNPKELILSTHINEVVYFYQSMAQRKNISLSYSQTEEITVYADPNMLNTVLRNLISNALKFTHKQGNITVSAIAKNNSAEVTVADNGVGMSDEAIKNLFYTNTNSSSIGTENEKGSGLGLLLCKDFTEKQKGAIWAESNGTKGSQFKFTLPLFKA